MDGQQSEKYTHMLVGSVNEIPHLEGGLVFNIGDTWVSLITLVRYLVRSTRN